MPDRASSSPRFWHPRYWPTWLFLGFLRLLALLPFKPGLKVGAALGLLSYHLIGARRRVTEVNISLCFPELTETQRRQLVRDNFRSTGIGLVEIAWAWWGRLDKLPLRVVGDEHLRSALAQGRGVLLLGAHYTTIELSGRHFSTLVHPVVGLYRPDDNALMQWMISRQRAHFCAPVPRSDLRQVRRALFDNCVVWLAPDQDFGIRNAEFVQFFGAQAATLTMPTRLAKLNDSPVIFVRHQREADNYVIEMTPLPEFTCTGPKEDAAMFNAQLERSIRQHPEQYLWMHKRFKTQPDGNQKLYRAAGC